VYKARDLALMLQREHDTNNEADVADFIERVQREAWDEASKLMRYRVAQYFKHDVGIESQIWHLPLPTFPESGS